MKYFITIILFILIFPKLYSQALTVEKAPEISISQWDIDSTIRAGVIWRYLHKDDFFESNQSINVLEVNLEEAGLKLAFGYVDSSRILSSQMAKDLGAVVAINGTFFNMQFGGSVCYFKVNNSVIDTSSIRSDYGDEAALAIDENEGVAIISRPKGGWQELKSYRDVMSAGPILVIEGKNIPPKNTKFNRNRHPRTAIGIQSDGDLVMVTVDGRNAQAQGMSIPELTQLLLALECVDALNMDGGGSTSMWIKGFPDEGIVNFPSDNGKFDHKGQRTVANIIGLVEKRD